MYATHDESVNIQISSLAKGRREGIRNRRDMYTDSSDDEVQNLIFLIDMI